MARLIVLLVGIFGATTLLQAQSIQKPKGQIGPSQKAEMQNFLPAFKTAQDSSLESQINIDCLNSPNGGARLYWAQGSLSPIVGYISGTVADTFGYGGSFYWFFVAEQGQYFQFSGTHKLKEVGVFFGAKSVVGVGDDYNITIYNDSTLNTTATAIGSMTYNTGNITASTQFSQGFNTFTFAQPINFTDKFVVGIESWSLNGDDTIGIVISNPDTNPAAGLNGGCGLQQNKWLQRHLYAAYNNPSQFIVDEWVVTRTSWGSGVGLDGDLIIIPTIEIQTPTGKDEPYGTKNGALRLYGVFPNPACDASKVLFELDRDDDARIIIMDVTGKFLYDKTIQGKAGLNEHILDLSNVPNGYYTYIVTTNNGRVASKISISK